MRFLLGVLSIRTLPPLFIYLRVRLALPLPPHVFLFAVSHLSLPNLYSPVPVPNALLFLNLQSVKGQGRERERRQKADPILLFFNFEDDNFSSQSEGAKQERGGHQSVVGKALGVCTQ